MEAFQADSFRTTRGLSSSLLPVQEITLPSESESVQESDCGSGFGMVCGERGQGNLLVKEHSWDSCYFSH